MKVFVVIPNWNGGVDYMRESIDSLLKQPVECSVIVVDNASTDGSREYIKENFSEVIVLENSMNLGFAGGVNPGIKYALQQNADFVGLFNNDAVADKHWLEELLKTLQRYPEAGAAACKLLTSDGKKIDTTGDFYSIWGLTISRQRNKLSKDAINEEQPVFGACAGACLYRSEMLREVGYFDQKFFAYYEDTDFNFRAQLYGWKVYYSPKAVAYHAIGATGNKIKGFTTTQTMKNLPLLAIKNVPSGLLLKIMPRFYLAYLLILTNSVIRGRGVPAMRGVWGAIKNTPYALGQRRIIQSNRKVSNAYISSILVQDLPPDAQSLRKFRSFFTRQS